MEINNYYDVIIVGSGLAGLYTASNIDESKSVLLITKDKIEISNSSLAQGGIAGELICEEASCESHIEDSLQAGSYINDRDALKILVYESGANLQKLIDYGVNFDKDENGNILLTREGGHSKRRILHCGGDATGKEIVNSMAKLVLQKENITILEHSMVTDLITQDNTCYGVYALSEDNLLTIKSASTVICTGGIGEIYKNSTNPSVATGDGLAISNRAGAEINNMEFIQFHPTAFFTEDHGQRFLITEAMRGEGAILRNIEKNEFMHKYHELKELAPRDIVSQSIYREMYDTWSDHVYLDVTHLNHDFIKNRFPTIYKKCLDYGIDITKDLIPVAPVEHFLVGGITININGQTTIDNLYASGEASDSGVHGANRLASNSLLECIVFSKRIANNINIKKTNSRVDEIETKTIKYQKSLSNYNEVRQIIKDTMDRYVGIVRTKDGLNTAYNTIKKIYDNLIDDQKTCLTYYEMLNMATISLLIIEAALKREKSIGCHYRIN